MEQTFNSLPTLLEETKYLAPDSNMAPSLDYHDGPLSKKPRLEPPHFRCDLCDIGFTTGRARTRHFSTEQHRRRGGLPPVEGYHCSSCPERFTRDYDRIRHENRKHGLVQAQQSSVVEPHIIEQLGSPIDPDASDIYGRRAATFLTAKSAPINSSHSTTDMSQSVEEVQNENSEVQMHSTDSNHTSTDPAASSCEDSAYSSAESITVDSAISDVAGAAGQATDLRRTKSGSNALPESQKRTWCCEEVA